METSRKLRRKGKKSDGEGCVEKKEEKSDGIVVLKMIMNSTDANLEKGPYSAVTKSLHKH